MNNDEFKDSSLKWVLSAFSLLLSLFLLNRTFFWLSKGYDLTDEGFYLNWISNPKLYSESLTQFGFLLNPLYELVGGDIYSLRVISLLITLILSSSLIYVAISLNFKEHSKLYILMNSFSLSLYSLNSLILFGLWMPTPSYNTINLQGLILASIGTLFVGKKKPFYSLILISLGVNIVFLAKPTSAAFFIISLIVYLAVTKNLNYPFLIKLLLMGISLHLALGLWIDGSIVKFYSRLWGGYEGLKLMTEGDSYVFRNKPSFRVNIKEAFVLLGLGLPLFVFTCQNHNSKLILRIKWFLLCLIFAISILIILFPELFLMKRTLWLGVIIAGPILVSLTFLKLELSNFSLHKVVVFLLCIPLIYAFGTGANIYSSMMGASIFGVVAATLIIFSVRNFLLNSAWCGMVIICSCLLLNSAAHHPYRQDGTIFNFSKSIIIGKSFRYIAVSNEVYDYLTGFSRIVYNNGFKINKPMIDLTGKSPGLVFAINAKAIGLPWLIGKKNNYDAAKDIDGNSLYVLRSLKNVSCVDISLAWILTDPNGSRPIQSKILNKFGISLDNDYELIEIYHPLILSKYTVSSLQIYKPINSKKILFKCKKN